MYPQIATEGLSDEAASVYDRVIYSQGITLGMLLVNETRFSTKCSLIPAVGQTYGVDAFNTRHWNITMADGSMHTVHNTGELYPHTSQCGVG